DADDGHQDRDAEDSAGEQVAAQEGEHVDRHRDGGQQTKPLYGALAPGRGLVLAEEPEAGGDHAERDPAERPGVDVSKQDLPGQGTEVEPVQDAYRNGDDEDEEARLEEPENLGCIWGARTNVPVLH